MFSIFDNETFLNNFTSNSTCYNRSESSSLKSSRDLYLFLIKDKGGSRKQSDFEW